MDQQTNLRFHQITKLVTHRYLADNDFAVIIDCSKTKEVIFLPKPKNWVAWTVVIVCKSKKWMIFRWKDRDIENWGDLENEFGRLL